MLSTMPGLPITAPRHGAFALLLLLAVGAVYANSLGGVFLYDDHVDVIGDPVVRRGVSALPGFMGRTRPLARYSFALNWACGGNDPTGYHVVNVAIHAAATLLLFALADTTLRMDSLRGRFTDSAGRLAFVIALLWGVHPLQTESVTYVTQRYESLVSMFYLLAVYAFARSTVAARPREVAWQCLSVAACGLGMLSKEVMVTAPVVILLYDRIFVAGSWVEIARRRWSYSLALAATWLLLAPSLGMVAEPSQDWVGFHLGTTTYLQTQAGVMLHYLRLCFVPFPQCLDWNWQPATRAAEILPAAALVLTAIGLTTVGIARNRPAAWLAAAFFLILSPTSSILPLGDLACEHRMYLASAAVIAGVVLAGDRVLRGWAEGSADRRRSATRAALCLVVGVAAVLGLLTVRRNALYGNRLAFWQDNARIVPDGARVQGSLGEALRDVGDVDGALRAFARCQQIAPTNAVNLFVYGDLLRQLGRLPEAIALLSRSTELWTDSRPLESLGMALCESGRVEAGLEALDRAAAADPDRGDIRINYAVALLKAGRGSQAIARIQTELAREPNNEAGLRALLLAQGATGDLDGAIATARRLIAVNPRHADAHARLGQLLLWKERPDDAIGELRIAAGIDRRQPRVFEILATACESAGRYAEAAAAFAEALAVHDEIAGNAPGADEKRRQLVAALEACRARAKPP